MIKIKKDDSLSKIIKKISSAKSKEIFLNFPIGHGVIHDFNSLKILKKKFHSKKLIFVTKDIASKRLLIKLGLGFSIIKDEEYLKQIAKKEDNILKTNTSFFEYLSYEIQKNTKKIKEKFSKKKQIVKRNHSFPFIFVGTIFTASIFLLFFIFYFAVHKTYIEISPEVEILKIQKNFRFNNSAELSLDNNTIKLKEITLNTSIRESFSSTNIEYELEKQSRGEVILKNERAQNISLIATTRLQTKDGIIYRIQKTVDIAAANFGENNTLVPSETTVYVVADSYDIHGNFVGSRGNLENITLSIPGLTGDFKNKISGVSQKLTGGVDEYKVIVGEDDIEKASDLLKIKLENTALKKLQEKIKQSNELNNENYELLLSQKAIQYSDFVYNNTNATKVGDIQKKFELDGSIKIRAYLFNKDFVLSRLRSLVTKKLIDNSQELIHIDNSSLSIAHTIYDRNNNNSIQVKATMGIEAYVHRNFDENGYYSELLKNKIVGLGKNEAYDILLNSNNINKVSIKNSPFFLKNISGKVENIFFRRKD